MDRAPFIAVARGIFKCGDRYALCRAKGYDFWFFPGGGIEEGEDAKATLKREAVEEMGLTLENVDYVATVQNRYPEKGVMVNEMCLVFRADIPAGTAVESLEEHIEIGLFTIEDIKTMNLLPPTLKQALIDLHDGVPVGGFIGLKE